MQHNCIPVLPACPKCTHTISTVRHLHPSPAPLCSEDVREAREFLDSVGLDSCRVLAKVETRQSLLNFRGILAIADGIILSRCVCVRHTGGLLV